MRFSKTLKKCLSTRTINEIRKEIEDSLANDSWLQADTHKARRAREELRQTLKELESQ